MPGLPSELGKELRSALLECGPFESNAELRRVFADDRLYPWRHQVPEAASRQGRVEAVLAFLPDKYHERSGNALLALLEVSQARLDPEDSCYQQLAGLAAKWAQMLDQGAPGRVADPVRRFGRYELQEELGRGSFAVVHKARDTTLNRPVALKVLHPIWQDDARFVARFKFEAQAMANLRDPHIVRVLDSGQSADSQVYIAMEFLPGRTLRAYLQEHGALPLLQVLVVVRQIGAALDYAHSRGMVHCDLKPANVMVEETAAGLEVTLTDFGLVKAMEGSVALTLQASALGTPEYMAPEQADPNRNDIVGPAADRYALGVLAYKLLTGRVPFPGNSSATLYAHEYKEPPAPSQFCPDLPPAAEAAVLQMLAKAPEARFATCAAFVTALAASSSGSPARKAKPPVPAVKVPEVWVHPVTGKEMVRIPAGAFPFSGRKEPLDLPEFWLDKTPVTNADYARFVAATGHPPPKHWNGKPDPPTRLLHHPVVYVRVDDIDAYLRWAGCRLPAEEEWEKAARGPAGNIFPWSNQWKPNHSNTVEVGLGGTSPVGKFSPDGDSPYGCVDMSGNVWKRTSSRSGSRYVFRGGSFANDIFSARTEARFLDKTGWSDDCGFQACIDVAAFMVLQAEHGQAAYYATARGESPAYAGSARQHTNVWINPVSGKEMLLVPAGPFLFGEEPEARELPDYWLDKTPVTNAEYARFVIATGQKPPTHWEGNKPPLELAEHPVTNVTRQQALAYAAWAGGSLPTEMQWEKAARGVDGREYPWGAWAENHCNTREASLGKTSPVGQFSPAGDSPYGFVDMSGNVWEWTDTEASHSHYVVKGGAYWIDRKAARVSARHHYDADNWDINGFRVCVLAPFS